MTDEKPIKTKPLDSVKTLRLTSPDDYTQAGIGDDEKETFEVAQVELRRLSPPINLNSIIGAGGLSLVTKATTRGIVYGNLDLEAECAVKVPLLKLVRGGDDRINKICRKLINDEGIHCLQTYIRLIEMGKGFERNLVRCHKLWSYDVSAKTMPYIVFEYVNGPNLYHYKRLSFEHIARIGVITCEILGAVHSIGILHTDIKPSNILIPKGRIRSMKLADFGLSRGMYTPSPGEELMAVSFGFAAPEQIITHGKVDVFSDIYSLGATLYFMVTRNLLYQEADGRALNKIGKPLPKPKRIGDIRPDTPPDLIGIIERMIQPDPAKRYHGVDEIKCDLLAAFPKLKRNYDSTGRY